MFLAVNIISKITNIPAESKSRLGGNLQIFILIINSSYIALAIDNYIFSNESVIS